MNIKTADIRDKLVQNNLKVTPQRLTVLETVLNLKTHPTTEQIIAVIKKKHPNIASGTIYKILDTLTEKNIIKKVKTDKDVMRYDAVEEDHHHLYCAESDRIEDYFDEDLNQLLSGYFKKKEIPDFEIENVRLQIIGKFLNKKGKTKVV